MNKHVLNLNGTYKPITQTKLRLPSSYPVYSESEIASRQVTSMFASVWAEPVTEDKKAEAQALLDRALTAKQADADWLQDAAEEFSLLRG